MILHILLKLIQHTNFMKTVKKSANGSILTGERIVQKKLDKANATLKKMDLSKLPWKHLTTKQD